MNVPETETKLCRGCGRVLPLEMFYVNRVPGGRMVRCRDCKRAAFKAYVAGLGQRKKKARDEPAPPLRERIRIAAIADLALDLIVAAACLRQCQEAGQEAVRRWQEHVQRLQRRVEPVAPAPAALLAIALERFASDGVRLAMEHACEACAAALEERFAAAAS
jgi:hypothetical protein